jgi:hypothetical protein
LTKEELLDSEVAKTVFKKVGLLTRIQQSEGGTICEECLKRFVSMKFRVKNRMIPYEMVMQYLKENGFKKVHFEDVVKFAYEKGWKLQLRIRKTEWSKVYKRMQYRKLKELRDWDMSNRIAEGYGYIEFKRVKKKKEKERPTLDEIRDLVRTAKTETVEPRVSDVKKGLMILSVLQRKLEPEQVDKPRTIEEALKVSCKGCAIRQCIEECRRLKLMMIERDFKLNENKKGVKKYEFERVD